MIISHAHRFCFFAIPRTGSSAIKLALLEAGIGQEIKPRHISYTEFMSTASPEVKNYYTFTSVRHPLDSVVSAYFKRKNDHNGRFSRGTFKNRRPIANNQLEAFRFIRDTGADFPTYFEHFHCTPYRKPRHQATVTSVNRILRFESLQEDFSKVMKELDLPEIILPRYNSTAGRVSGYQSYYPPRIQHQAKEMFGDIMDAWGYNFPTDWE